jgi:hypothetical protein
VPGIKDLIMESNNAFNQCVRKGALGAAGTGLTTTFWDRKNNPDPVLNVADLSVGLQADCLTEHPLAAADPNYRGLFLPGNPGVDPIIEIMGIHFTPVATTGCGFALLSLGHLLNPL